MNRVMPRRRESRSGFTLIELLIVIVVMGIVAMLVVPEMAAAQKRSVVNAAAQEVLNAIEYARLSAMTSGRQTRFFADFHSNYFEVEQYHFDADLFGGGDLLAESDVEGGSYERMRHPLDKSGEYVLVFDDDERFQGVNMFYSDFTVSKLVFDGQGSPSRGGWIGLSKDGESWRITVDSVTGEATMARL